MKRAWWKKKNNEQHVKSQNRRRQRPGAALFHYHGEHMRRRESTRPAVHSIMAQIGGNGFWNYIFRASHCASAARGFPVHFLRGGALHQSHVDVGSPYILTSGDQTNRTGFDEQIVCLVLRTAPSINIYKAPTGKKDKVFVLLMKKKPLNSHHNSCREPRNSLLLTSHSGRGSQMQTVH